MSEKNKSSKPDSPKKDTYGASDLGKSKNFERIDTTSASIIKKGNDSKPLHTPKNSNDKKNS